jgi:hypothetical protein
MGKTMKRRDPSSRARFYKRVKADTSRKSRSYQRRTTAELAAAKHQLGTEINPVSRES